MVLKQPFTGVATTCPAVVANAPKTMALPGEILIADSYQPRKLWHYDAECTVFCNHAPETMALGPKNAV